MQVWCEANFRKLRQGHQSMRCVMKGFGVERVIAAGKSVERDVNSSLRRSPSEGGESCQERVDTKAFTGKGDGFI